MMIKTLKWTLILSICVMLAGMYLGNDFLMASFLGLSMGQFFLWMYVKDVRDDTERMKRYIRQGTFFALHRSMAENFSKLREAKCNEQLDDVTNQMGEDIVEELNMYLKLRE